MEIRTMNDLVRVDMLDEYDKYHTEYVDNTDAKIEDYDILERNASAYAIEKCNEAIQTRTSTNILKILKESNFSMFVALTDNSQFFNGLTKDELITAFKEFAYAMEAHKEQMTQEEITRFKENLIEQMDF